MNPLKDNLFFALGLLVVAVYTPHSFAERADRDKPIQIEADHVTVDDANQVSTFEGNVQMRQGTLLIEAAKIVVAQDKKGFSQITATGQLAYFRQKRDGVNQYAEGFGERIEYDNFIEVANIYGQARVKREGDDVKGEHIVYNTQTGVFKVFGNSSQNPDSPGQGRVQIIIQPKDQQPKDSSQKDKSGEAAPSMEPIPTQPTPAAVNKTKRPIP